MKWKITVFIFALSALNGFAANPDPTVVTLLTPGITAQRLPVNLTNINSVEYAPDGRLFAVGYDGRIHILTDTDDDGLEDKVTPFWDKKGALLTPVGIVIAPEGVYVPARGKVVLLKDTNGDGRADVSEIVATDWVQEKHNSATRNDASGLAMDAERNLYFCLGCSSYNNAFLLDKKGKPHYSLKSERGAIIKVSPDRKSREIFATGLRFVTGLRFNKRGDLFGTDQEGDTWFPGGNPRDELLHIIKDRHYGFPFRDPKYLPDVIDEPSVVDFQPQHQSTCGFRFNEVTKMQPKRFGPDFWEGDAIVSGFSRGKLWRAPLAKNRAGYVGRQVQIAAFNSLPTDVALSPTGDLLVTCHSGRPDWGSGPGGKAHLFKLSYTDPAAPQPVMAWAQDPLTVKVAFDKRLDLKQVGEIEIVAGEFVREGDDLEEIQPGYKVVKNANRSPRHRVKVLRTELSDDGRTLTMATSPLPWNASYVVKMPQIGELSFRFSGANAEWIPQGKTKPTWTGILPHLDLIIARQWIGGSAEHEALSNLWKKAGTLKVRSRLTGFPERETTTLRFESSRAFAVMIGGKRLKSEKGKPARHWIEADLQKGVKQPVNVEIETATGGGKEPDVDLSFHTSNDPYERAVPLNRLHLPWAPTMRPPSVDEEITLKDGQSLKGDPDKGKELFTVTCAICHQFQGVGKNTGPDLTTSLERDPAAVLRDIIEPSAAINPDYVSYIVKLTDGKALIGTLQDVDAGQVRLFDAAGQEHVIARSQIASVEASPISLMPLGFSELGKDKLADLTAFLCAIDPEAEARNRGAGFITRQFWKNVKGSTLADLRKHPGFPEKPDGSDVLTQFEGPTNWANSFGARIAGFVRAPQTGNYIFWVSGDDQVELWLSESADSSKKKKIAWTTSWTKPRAWDLRKPQQSAPIHLEAGKSYFIEAIQMEATVDDCIAVGWKLPTGRMERPIPGQRLSPDTPVERAMQKIPASEKPVRLFNGHDLEGWDGAANHWTVEDGAIRGTNTRMVESSTYLFTKKKYREFRLVFEMKQTVSDQHSKMHSAIAALGEQIADEGNNKHGFKGPLFMFGHTWGIWDAHGRKRIVPGEFKGEKIGDWNVIEILVKGDRIQMAENGKLVFDFTDEKDKLKTSPIGLQLHANSRPQEFHFRGLILSETPGDKLITVGE